MTIKKTSKRISKKKTAKKVAKKKTTKKTAKQFSARSTDRARKKAASKKVAKQSNSKMTVQKNVKPPVDEADVKMGRPTVMTEEVLGKLRALFTIGISDELACDVVGIHRDSLYSYQDKHPEFKEEKRLLKQNPVISAKKNVVAAIKNGDMKTTRWYLERKCKDEFGKSVDVTSGGEKVTGIVFEFVGEAE